ncbi:MAG: 50S ribosomal protein L30e [Thermoplasmata archaeon]|nr:50S ribosomal protein L30e [Euryarchaeota archaeon]RLF65948.1 MAG: 50S ribosomal protein L30e [Thermoplasmata archaeon]
MNAVDIIRNLSRQGKVLYGADQARKSLERGIEVKLIIMAKNCPKDKREKIEKLAVERKVPIYYYDDTAENLGILCGKPFVVTTLTVLDNGSVDISPLLSGVSNYE